MSPYRRQIETVLQALMIQLPTSFAWFGRRYDMLAPRAKRAMTDETARAYLLYNLQHQLYGEFYCRGVAVPGSTEPQSFGVMDQQLVEVLSAANRGRGTWQAGWKVQALEGPRVVVRRHGLDVWARREECSAKGKRLRTGMSVKVRLPNEFRKLSPGFYMALGEAELDEACRLVRLYWHLTPSGAVPFVEAATELLNEAGIGFRLKVVNDPDRFTRCDAGVIYAPKSAFDRLAVPLAELCRQLAPLLRTPVPAFTKQLAPGLALAEDPGDGDSFGMHRCGVLADGLIRGAEQGLGTIDQRLEAVAARFDDAGLSLERPFLNAGSDDVYDLRAA